MKQSEHIIEKTHLKEFSYSGCGSEANYKSYIVINGIRVGNYISHIEIMNTGACEYPRIKIKGMLHRLDEETKRSWGIEG
ncbi:MULTISPECIES: hypothetical protein [Enterococcus]|uniref:hypothetical protein n=1 Tax=Enterococcus TaxID=1350 RepID=UPI002DBD6F96|nr:hypothetical protein [Enterococcus mundtii]MEC3942658.1 hypothetical protein [Enterococcus mundtii]